MCRGQVLNGPGGLLTKRQRNDSAERTLSPAPCWTPSLAAGTVGLVADRLDREAVLIEISPEYLDMARKRIRDSCPMFYEEVVG